MVYSREDLIQICRDAVVPYTKWNDRDSYSAQRNIQSIYEGLSVGLEYTISIDGNSIDIYFKPPTDAQLNDMVNNYLEIDSRDSYIDWYIQENGEDSNPEMFDGYGIDWRSDYLGSYMPTRERLDNANGYDWY